MYAQFISYNKASQNGMEGQIRQCKVGKIKSLCYDEGQLESPERAAAAGWLTTTGLVVPPFPSRYILFLLALTEGCLSNPCLCPPPVKPTPCPLGGTLRTVK